MPRLLPALLPALACAASAQPAQMPQTLRWGDATVRITPRSEADFSGTATATISRGGQTLVTLKEWSVEASFEPLRPGGSPELVLTSYSGGAHCCTTYYIFTRDEGEVRNLLVLDVGNYRSRFVDLNGDGTDEILHGDDEFAYYDYSYAESPGVRYVLGWDEVRVADLTRRFAWVPQQEAGRDRAELDAQLGPDGELSTRKAMLIGYFANSVVAGRGKEAEADLRANVLPKDPALKAWWSVNRAPVLSTMYNFPGARLSITDARVLPEEKPK